MSRNERRRLLFVVNSLAGGGAERMMLNLLRASQDRLDRYDLSLALLDDETRDYEPPTWLRIHQLHGRRSLLRSVRVFGELARSERPDLTLSFLTRSNLSTVVAAKRLNHRAIISERANTSGHFKPNVSGWIAKSLIRVAYPYADAVVAPSEGVGDDLVDNFGVKRARVTTIHNPVDSGQIQALGREIPSIPLPSGPYIVCVSRLTPSKNVRLVVEAFALLDSSWSLVILGQGPERAAIEAQIAAAGLGDRVSMPGFVANPYPIIRQAACYVSGSNGEGFPNGLIEALALGVPTVSTNCASGPSEILADQPRKAIHGLAEGRWGVLVPPGDAATMAQALRLIGEPRRSQHYASVGPMRAAEFGVRQATDRYWATIEAGTGPSPFPGIGRATLRPGEGPVELDRRPTLRLGRFVKLSIPVWTVGAEVAMLQSSRRNRVNIHRNARLTPQGRKRLVRSTLEAVMDWTRVERPV